MKPQKHILALSTALLFGASSLLAQSAGTTSGGTTTGSTSTRSGTTTGSTSTSGGATTGTSTMGDHHGKANPHTPNANASAAAQAVQTILAKFDANRDAYMAERKALLDKLAAAKTDAERQAILAQLKADQQAEKDQRTQLGKEIRDQLKNLRKNGGG